MNVVVRGLLLLLALGLAACTNALPQVTSLSSELAPVRITSPADASFFNHTNSFSVSGSCIAGGSEVSVEVAGAPAATVDCSDGAFTANISLPAGDGAKIVGVRQTDPVSGDEASSFVTYHLDTVMPVIVFASPMPGTVATSTNAFVITGTCEAGLPITISGDVASPSGANCEGGNFSISLNFTATEGAKVVTLMQTDRAGNSGSDVRNFELDYPDPEFFFVTGGSSIQENAGSLVVSVELVEAMPFPVTVEYAVTPQTAAGAGVDYTLNDGTLSFAPGETSRSLTIPLIDDNISEGDEMFLITLQNPSNGGTITGTNPHSVTIIDNEGAPTIMFALPTESSNENESSATIDVMLSHPASYDIFVDFGFADDTATGGGIDYSGMGGTLTFAAGQTVQSITVTFNDDSIFEATESFGVYLVNPVNAFLSVAGTHTHFIVDNETPPVVRFASATSMASESASPHLITVELSHPASVTIEVSYQVTGGTATGGIDYLLNNGTLTFGPGIISRDLSMDVVNDSVQEPNETVTLQLTGIASGPAILSTNSAELSHTHFIENDDSGVLAIYRSVGPNNSGPLTGGDAFNSLNIFAGIATFTSALPNHIGLGDVIQFDSDTDGAIDSIVFISGRISATQYYVQTAAGATPANLATTTNWQIFRAYTSLTAALNGTENTSIQASLRNFDTWSGSRNLVSNNEQWNIALYGDGPVDGTMVDNWITSSTNYLRIFAPSAPDEVGVSQRHAGYYDAAKARISSGGSNGIEINVHHVIVEGLQVIISSTLNAGIVVDPLISGVQIRGNLVWHSNSGTNGGIIVESDGTAFIYNNIVYGFNGANGVCIRFWGGNGYAYNNTVVNCSHGIRVDSPGMATAKNNIAEFILSTAYEGLDGTSDRNLANAGVQFINPGAGDYRLSMSDTMARGNGLDLSADMFLSFNDDIAGQERTVPWDIGASMPAVAAFTWVGLTGNGLWSDAGNWSSGVVPSSADTAYFNNACAGGNCLVNINIPVAVGRIEISPSFQGSITQNNDVEVMQDFMMAGGAYNGNGRVLSVRDIIVSGGNLNMASSSLSVRRNFVANATTANFSESLVMFESSESSTVDVDSGFEFGHIQVMKAGAATVTANAPLIATGNVVLSSCQAVDAEVRLATLVNQTLAGTLACPVRDLFVDAMGVVSFSGTVAVQRDFVFLAALGGYYPDSGTLALVGDFPANVTPGSRSYGNVSINKSNFDDITLHQDWRIAGALEVTSPVGNTFNGADFLLEANAVVTSPEVLGNSRFAFVGTIDQFIRGNFSNILVDKSGGTLRFQDAVNVFADFTVTLGSSIDFAGNMLNFIWWTDNSGINSAVPLPGSVTIAKDASTGVIFQNPTTILGDLVINSFSGNVLQGQPVHVHGNLTHINGSGGNGEIHLVGNTAQTVYASNLYWPLVINKPANVSVTALSDVNMNGQNVTLIGDSVVHQKQGASVRAWTNINVLHLDANAKWIRSCAGGAFYNTLSGAGRVIEGEEVILSINDASAINEGQTAAFTVVSTPANCMATPIYWSTVNGTMSAPNDFNAVINELTTIPANLASTVINVQTFDDDAYEDPKYFGVTFYSPYNGANIANADAQVTVASLDSRPILSVSSNSAVNEGDGVFAAVVRLSHPTNADVTFTYQTIDQSAVASLGDYTAVGPATGTIPAGQTAATFNIAIMDDAVFEPSQEFIFEISNPSGPIEGLGTVAQMITILDNDSPPQLRFVAASSQVLEGEPYIQIEGALVGSTSDEAIEFTPDMDGDAVYGVDYEYYGGMSTVAIPPRTSTFSFRVAPLPSPGEAKLTKYVTFRIPSVMDVGQAVPLTGSDTHELAIVDETPMVVNVATVESNGAYTDGQTINIRVGFTRPVNVSGAPELILNTNPQRTALYVSGSGTQTLIFQYAIQPGDWTPELNIVGIVGGLIEGRDAPVHEADLTLPSLNLAQAQDIRINRRPVVAQTTCMVEAYANEFYRGCTFKSLYANESGPFPDDGGMYYLGPSHSCAWITEMDIQNGDEVMVPDTASDCVIAVQVNDGYVLSEEYIVPVRVRRSDGFAQVAQGGYHACVIVDGIVKCWGSNNAAQLGDANNTGNHAKYVVVRNNASVNQPWVNVKDVKVGGSGPTDGFSCGRDVSGRIACWGNNGSEKLGTGSPTTGIANTFVGTSGMPLTDVMSYDLGAAFGCAVIQSNVLSETGKIKCWGSNAAGQLGRGNPNPSNSASAEFVRDDYGELTGAVQVSLGANHACAVMGDGGVKCWGANNYGQIGSGSAETVVYAAETVPGFGPTNRALRVESGDNFNCVLTVDRRLYCWGQNSYGQVGDGHDNTNVPTPIEVDFGPTYDPVNTPEHKIVDFSLGEYTACAIFEYGPNNRAIKCWGGNGTSPISSGILGIGIGENQNQTNMASLQAVDLGATNYPYKITLGKLSACAIVGTSSEPQGVKCWGYNGNGQLGDGENVTGTKGMSFADMGDNLPFSDLYPKIFVTENIYMGYTLGATNVCALELDGQPMEKVTRPLLTVGGTPLYAFRSTIPILRTRNMGTLMPANIASYQLAPQSSALFSGSPLASAPTTFNGDDVLGAQVWTGANDLGGAAENCVDWTDDDANGSYGTVGQSNWMYGGLDTCVESKRVYCVLP